MKCITKNPEQKKKALEIANGPIRRLNQHPVAEQLGLNDTATWQWIWKKYTGKDWDRDFLTEIRDNDVARFNEGMTEFLSDMGKTQNLFQRYAESLQHFSMIYSELN